VTTPTEPKEPTVDAPTDQWWQPAIIDGEIHEGPSIFDLPYEKDSDSTNGKA